MLRRFSQGRASLLDSSLASLKAASMVSTARLTEITGGREWGAWTIEP